MVEHQPGGLGPDGHAQLEQSDDVAQRAKLVRAYAKVRTVAERDDKGADAVPHLDPARSLQLQNRFGGQRT